MVPDTEDGAHPLWKSSPHLLTNKLSSETVTVQMQHCAVAVKFSPGSNMPPSSHAKHVSTPAHCAALIAGISVTSNRAVLLGLQTSAWGSKVEPYTDYTCYTAIDVVVGASSSCCQYQPAHLGGGDQQPVPPHALLPTTCGWGCRCSAPDRHSLIVCRCSAPDRHSCVVCLWCALGIA